MIAPLATLVFLATVWLVTLLAAQLLGESGGKILAALKGRSPLATAPAIRPIIARVSQRPRLQRPLRAQPKPQFQPQLRAAA